MLVGDHHVGQVTDLILDPVEDTLLGFELRSLAGRSYFLPLALTLMRDGDLAATSPLHLVEDVAYYRSRGRHMRWAEAGDRRLELVSGRILADEPAA